MMVLIFFTLKCLWKKWVILEIKVIFHKSNVCLLFSVYTHMHEGVCVLCLGSTVM